MQATTTLFTDISMPNYDDHLDTHGFREEAMRFQVEPEKAQIGCFGHVHRPYES
jgi:hypothetical protein